MNDNGSDRLAAIEAAVTGVQSAVQNVLVGLGELKAGIQNQAETTARGFEALTELSRSMNARLSALAASISGLDARDAVLEARMAEVVHELRTHSHKAA